MTFVSAVYTHAVLGFCGEAEMVAHIARPFAVVKSSVLSKAIHIQDRAKQV